MKAEDQSGLISARWGAWRSTWHILHDPSLSNSEKVKQCDSVNAHHAAAWSDLEVYPKNHPIRLAREAMIDQLPAAMATASRRRENAARGQSEMTL